MQFWEKLALSETDNGLRGATLDGGEPVTQQIDMAEGSDGYWRPHRFIRQDPHFSAKMREAQHLITRAQSGNRWDLMRLQEAMTISDFNGYFGDVLNRSVLANYQETPYNWDQYLYRDTLNDTRIKKLFRFDRGASPLDGPILPVSPSLDGASGPNGLEQLSEYPLRRRVQTNYADQLFKFGARFAFSFELFLGDDLNALKDTPALLGRAARRTEASRATKLYSGSGGPNSTFFSDANYKNVVTNAGSNFPFVTTNNPVLSVESLQWALTIMMMQKDLDGQPISVEGVTLVVPPALKWAAFNIVRTSQIAMNAYGGTISSSGNTSQMRLYAPNPFMGIVGVAVDYYAPIVNTTNGNTAWYLFADPKNGRPAAQLSFLRGREAPQIFMKTSNQVAIGEGTFGPGAGVMPGGGMVNPMEGDFENDQIDYKERHFIGGTLLDPVCAVESNGSGS